MCYTKIMKVKEGKEIVSDYAGVEIHFINGDKLLFATLEQARSYMFGQGIIQIDEERLVENRLVVIQAYKERNM